MVKKSLVVITGCYCWINYLYSFIFWGLVCFCKSPYRERVSYGVICGSNNLALGVSLAFLYLPARDTVIFASWEVAWLGSMVLFQLYLKRQAG